MRIYGDSDASGVLLGVVLGDAVTFGVLLGVALGVAVSFALTSDTSNVMEIVFVP